jgi:hypothetical protein
VESVSAQARVTQIGVDEIYVGKKQKFLSVVSNLETGEPLWFGREPKKETLDAFFQTELSARQRRGIQAACVDVGIVPAQHRAMGFPLPDPL